MLEKRGVKGTRGRYLAQRPVLEFAPISYIQGITSWQVPHTGRLILTRHKRYAIHLRTPLIILQLLRLAGPAKRYTAMNPAFELKVH